MKKWTTDTQPPVSMMKKTIHLAVLKILNTIPNQQCLIFSELKMTEENWPIFLHKKQSVSFKKILSFKEQIGYTSRK